MITFHIPGPLRAFSGGRSDVALNTTGATVGEALQALWAACPGMRDRVVTEQGQVREHINIFAGKENIRYTGGLATPVSPGMEISIVPAISGGRAGKAGRNQPSRRLEEAGLFAGRPRKAPPHEFVLEALASLSPHTRPLFGCLAIYVGEKIMLILRDKAGNTADNGVWLATAEEHHESLRREFPNMRSVALLGKKVTAWQVLPADALDFEEATLRACELVLAGDPRIGKVPKRGNKAAGKQSKSRQPGKQKRRRRS